MFYWVAKNGKFHVDKWRFDLIPTVLYSVQEQCIFVDLLQIKGKIHCQESIIFHGVPAYMRT